MWDENNINGLMTVLGLKETGEPKKSAQTPCQTEAIPANQPDRNATHLTCCHAKGYNVLRGIFKIAGILFLAQSPSF